MRWASEGEGRMDESGEQVGQRDGQPGDRRIERRAIVAAVHVRDAIGSMSRDGSRPGIDDPNERDAAAEPPSDLLDHFGGGVVGREHLGDEGGRDRDVLLRAASAGGKEGGGE